MAIQSSTTLHSWAFAPHELLCDALTTEVAIGDMVDELALGFIPASLRRRCSAFSKVTLAVAHAALRRASHEGPIPTVFSSIHGESYVTAALLNELARSEPLSPMGFSLSVHNAASGLFSIATGNTGPASALSSASDCFMMGVCEALTVLSQGDSRRVLLVCSDDRVADEFRREDEAGEPLFALALVLERSDQETGNCCLSFQRLAHDAREGRSEVSQGIEMARWLASDGTRLELEGRQSRWLISRAGQVSSSLYSSPRRS